MFVHFIYDMKGCDKMSRLTTAVALASMLVMSMAWAGAASAAGPLWLVCLEGAGLTKYSSNQCNKAESGGKWQSLGLLKSDTVRIVAFTLVFRDREGQKAENSLITCLAGGLGTGLIEPTNTAVIREAKVNEPGKNCAKLAGPCGEVSKVEGRDLPWKQTLIEGPEGKLLGKLEADGNGEPGWALSCKIAGVAVTDECKSEEGKPETLELINEITGGVLLIRGRFENAAEGSCSLAEGRKHTAEIHGLLAILLWNGNGLSINPV
jgi:hypothetical protein